MIDYKTATKDQLKAEMRRLSAVVSNTTFGTKKEFFHLPAILNAGEQPVAIASGMMDGNTWLITLTNQRIIFLDKGMIFGVKQVDVNLNNIVSVSGKTGLLFGDIIIATSGQNYAIKNVIKSCVIPFTNLINEIRNKPVTTAATESQTSRAALSFDEQMTKIERLAAMRDEGLLTDDEFQHQKQRILQS